MLKIPEAVYAGASGVSPAALSATGLVWKRGGRRILDRVSMQVAPGQVVGIVGPNGSGKTSLLRCIFRRHRPHAGRVTVDNRDIWSMTPRACARRIGVVLQELPAEFGFTLAEVVAMGRIPFKAAFAPDSTLDRALVAEMLRRVGLAELAGQRFDSLSGGEKQRGLIARALVQQPGLLLLDEPTNHLDIRYQFEVLELVRGLGVSIVITLHDLNLAAAVCDVVYVLKHGSVVATGSPREVFRPTLIRDVFDVEADVEIRPGHNNLRIVFSSIDPEGRRA